MDGIRLPFTRRVNQFFGSESSQAHFFAFFAIDSKYRFQVERLMAFAFCAPGCGILAG